MQWDSDSDLISGLFFQDAKQPEIRTTPATGLPLLLHLLVLQLGRFLLITFKKLLTTNKTVFS